MPVPFVTTLGIENVLSFGPKRTEIALGSLNVLIGPNGSGKSNLVEIIGMLRDLPREHADPGRPGGSFVDWIWKGTDEHTRPRFSLSVTLESDFAGRTVYSCTALVSTIGRVTFAAERVELCDDEGASEVLVERSGRGATLLAEGELSMIDDIKLNPGRSVLAQVRDPSRYTDLGVIADDLSRIGIHREWFFGGAQAARVPQRIDLENQILMPRYENLALVLQRLKRDSKTRRTLIEHVRALSPDFEDFDVAVEAGFIHLLIQERGWSTPAARLSEGTLRWLTLLAILIDPQPPPLLVIEEPELGLHPDLIVRLAEILKGAASRTQVIVTTHSDVLVDAIAEPEALIVFEKHQGVSRVMRPDARELREWLKNYSLGRLWLDGELGGKRW